MIHHHKFFHWFYYGQNKHSLYNIGTGLFIWLFLTITQSFGVYEGSTSFFYLFLYLLTFGILWVLTSYSIDFINSLFFSKSRRENYRFDFTIWVFKLFVLVNSVYVLREVMCNWNCVDLLEYLQIWLACTLMLMLTYLPFSIYARYKYFHSIVGANSDKKGIDKFELKGEGKKSIYLELENVLYMSADDNYVDIFQTSEPTPDKLLFRGTIKSIEEQLAANNRFIRVHRKYIINLQFIVKSDKRQTVLIKDGSYEKKIPVSKKYEKELRLLIE